MCVHLYICKVFSVQICINVLENYLSELWLRLHNCGSVKENKPAKCFKNTSRLDINNSTDIKMNLKYFPFIIQNT